jgi:hypothetical protein
MSRAFTMLSDDGLGLMAGQLNHIASLMATVLAMA